MTMTATVLRVEPQRLLVRDEENGQEVLVLFRNANRFSSGDRIRITFNGQMTFSIPPQITAISIERLRNDPRPTPSRMNAVVLQTGRNFLIVRNTQSRQLMRVEFPHAHHFCAGQRVNIRYDTIILSNPPRVTATDITPVC